MDDSNRDTKPTLLVERLRREKISTKEEWLEIVPLITEHRSEIPAKLRPIIVAASARDKTVTTPMGFYTDFYTAVRNFFLLPHTIIEGRMQWEGPDKDVDTEDEIELVIRLFPSILHEKRLVGRHELWPLNIFMASIKAVAFVPLLLNMCNEFGKGDMDLWKNYYRISNRLLINRNERWKNDDQRDVSIWWNNKEPSSELDEQSLLALIRMKEIGLVEEDETQHHIVSLFNMGHNNNKPQDIDAKFFETRLRLLIEWNPSLLINVENRDDVKRNGCISLLTHFVVAQQYQATVSLCVPMFQVIFELGMSYFPENLGFLFHARNFNWVCNWLGTEEVTQITKDTIFRTLEQINKSTLYSLILRAATNDDISLDGLYTLLHYNPLVFFSALMYKTQEKTPSTRVEVKHILA